MSTDDLTRDARALASEGWTNCDASIMLTDLADEVDQLRAENVNLAGSLRAAHDDLLEVTQDDTCYSDSCGEPCQGYQDRLRADIAEYKTQAETTGQRLGAARAALERVRALHARQPFNYDRMSFGQTVFPDECRHCRATYPCVTVTAITTALEGT